MHVCVYLDAHRIDGMKHEEQQADKKSSIQGNTHAEARGDDESGFMFAKS